MSAEAVTITLFVLVVAVILLVWRVRALSRKLREITFQKKSGEVLHGKSWEHFAPFMEYYPYDPENFRFIGSPIDGISFEDDKVVFLEFKTGQSKLTPKQKNIRAHVEEGRVAWEEVRG